MSLVDDIESGGESKYVRLMRKEKGNRKRRRSRSRGKLKRRRRREAGKKGRKEE